MAYIDGLSYKVNDKDHFGFEKYQNAGTEITFQNDTKTLYVFVSYKDVPGAKDDLEIELGAEESMALFEHMSSMFLKSKIETIESFTD
jgi:hypothetical protein